MKIRGLTILLSTILLASGCISRDNGTALAPTDYADWSSTVDAPLRYQIPGHTMGMRKIYINETGKQLTIAGNGKKVVHEYPEGTIILKENYPTDDSLAASDLTVMIKAKKDPRARGGWIWLAKNVESGEEMIFSDEFCFTCHQNANEPHPYGDGNVSGEFRDFVFYPWDPGNGE